MIYIVNLNPSIDYYMAVDNLLINRTNRSNGEQVKIGGKGINVASVLNNYEISSTLLGFIGGFTGDYIKEEMLKKENVRCNFIQTVNPTRINVKLKSRESEIEINARGAEVNREDLFKLEEKLEKLEGGDILVLSGSMLPGMPDEWYLDQIAKLSQRKIMVFLDDASNQLKSSLDLGVYLIKPNKEEFSKMMGKDYESEEEMILDAKKVMKKYPNSRMILSLGAKGSHYIHGGRHYYAYPIEGDVVHTVGAGDSMIAGYLAALIQDKPEEICFKFAVASASASVFSNTLATKKGLQRYLKHVKIKEVR